MTPAVSVTAPVKTPVDGPVSVSSRCLVTAPIVSVTRESAIVSGRNTSLSGCRA